jgi:hypothetical protein
LVLVGDIDALKDQQFSESNLMDLYFVEVLVDVLCSCEAFFDVLLLYGYHSIVIVLASKTQEVILINFEEAQTIKRMDHLIESHAIL